MNNEFVAQENMQLIWNILEEKYKGKMDNTSFKQDFQMLKRRIGSSYSEFKNLIQMNKLFLMECSKLLETKPSKDSVFKKNLKNKEDEFKKMMKKDAPPNIDFTSVPKGDLEGDVGNLYSKHMQERNVDIANIAKGYNIQNAQHWINNEVPPPLSIDHGSSRNITSEPINIPPQAPIQQPKSRPSKRVTFQTPLEDNNFLSKLKKKTTNNLKTQNLCINPDEVSNNKIFFNRTMGYVKEFTLKKIILPNISRKHTNALNQETIEKLSNEFFILYIIRINGHIEKNNLLMVKKNYDEKIVLFDMDEKIIVNEEVKHIEISIYNNQNDPILIPTFLELQYFIKGSQLTVEQEQYQHFCNDIYSYLIFKDDMFNVGEKFLVKNDLVTIIGTCMVTAQDGRYILNDTDHSNNTNHNCCIIKWEGDNINVIQTVSRMPFLHLSMIS